LQLQKENKLVKSSVMVTAGANQVFPTMTFLNIRYSFPKAFRFRRGGQS
jgi:hypothetical protein